MVDFELLKSFEIFENLTNDQLRKLQPFCFTEIYKKGEKLFQEGDKAEQIWIEYGGKIDLRFELPGSQSNSEEQTVEQINVRRPKEARTLGWSCFVPPYRMRLSAYCVSDTCEVLKIDKRDLQELFNNDPRMGYYILSNLIQEVGYRFHEFQNGMAKLMGENIINQW
ncbi:MAG: Crp/Fnr family transcriptional regulator [Thermodesulfobacteriota bacterium]